MALIFDLDFLQFVEPKFGQEKETKVNDKLSVLQPARYDRTSLTKEERKHYVSKKFV